MDTNTDLILQESDRAKLDDIVSKMQSNKESDDNIRWVVNDFKSKYGKSQGTEPSDASIPQVDLSKPGQPLREVALPELQDLTKQFTTPEKPIDIPIGGAIGLQAKIEEDKQIRAKKKEQVEQDDYVSKAKGQITRDALTNPDFNSAEIIGKAQMLSMPEADPYAMAPQLTQEQKSIISDYAHKISDVQPVLKDNVAKIERDHNDVDAANNLGSIYDFIGDKQAALNYYTIANAKKDNDKALTGIGIVYHQLGEDENAKSAYADALKINPNNYYALTNSAYLDAKEGNYDAAKAKADDLKMKYPDDPYSYQLSSFANYKKGDESAAKIDDYLFQQKWWKLNMPESIHADDPNSDYYKERKAQQNIMQNISEGMHAPINYFGNLELNTLEGVGAGLKNVYNIAKRFEYDPLSSTPGDFLDLVNAGAHTAFGLAMGVAPVENVVFDNLPKGVNEVLMQPITTILNMANKDVSKLSHISQGVVELGNTIGSLFVLAAAHGKGGDDLINKNIDLIEKVRNGTAKPTEIKTFLEKGKDLMTSSTLNQIQEATDIWNTIPKDLPAEKKNSIAPLLASRKINEINLKNANGALKDYFNNKIKGIDEKISNIINTTEVKPTEPAITPVVKEAIKVAVPKNVVEEEIDGLAQKIKSGAELTERESQIKASLPEQVNAALVRIGEKPMEVTAEKVTEAPIKEENLNLFNGKNKVVTNATKTYERVKIFKGDILAAIKEDADRGVQEAIDILANKNYDRFTRANEYIYNKFKGDYDAVKFENVGREGGQVPTEYLDLGEKKFYSTDRTHAKLYSLSDRSSKYAFKEEAVAAEGKPVEPVAAEVKVEAPKIEIKTEPSEGDKIELAPQIEGGIPRRMVFKDGEWHQEVGRETSPVGNTVKKQAQAEWIRQNEAKPVEVAPEVVPTAKKEEKPEVVKAKEGLASILGTKPTEAAAEAPEMKVVKSAVENVQKSLESSGIKVEVFDNEGEYNAETQRRGGQGSQGVFLDTEGRVLINKSALEKGFETVVVWHEGTHPVINIIRNTNPKLYDSIVRGLQEARDSGVEGIDNVFTWADENYKGEDRLNDEKIVETIARIADGKINLPDLPKSLRQDIIDFINKVARSLGIKQLISDSDMVAFKRTAEKIATTLREGRDISEVVGEKNLKKYGAESLKMISSDILEPTTLSQESLGKRGVFGDKIKYKEGGYNLSHVKEEDLVDIKKLIEDVAKEGKKVWFWTADQLGIGYYSDKSIEGEHYLDAGPSYPLDTKNRELNIIWASGAEAESLKKRISSSDYIFIISGSPEQSKLFNKQVIRLLGKRIDQNAGGWDKFRKNVIKLTTKVTKEGIKKTNIITDLIKKYKSFDELINSKGNDRKNLFIELEAQRKTKNTPLKQYLDKNNLSFNVENLRDGFFRENKFGINDIMLVLKPTELGGKSSHSTYENNILGEVIGVPDRIVNAINILPKERRDRYKEASMKSTMTGAAGSLIDIIQAPIEEPTQASRGLRGKPAEMPKEDEVVPKAKVPGFNRGIERVNEVAEKYKAKTGIKKSAHPPVERIYGDVSKNIADAYVEMKHDPSNPKVKKAYDAMINETKAQFNHILDEGIDIVRYTGEGEPYKSSKEMLADVKKGRLMFLPNDKAFGTPEAKEKFKDNIGLQNSGVKLKDGYELTNSELFRPVHDYFGHGLLGNEFGAIGEENATLQHLSLYSDDASPAVIAQTRGQNSWVNFSGTNAEALDLYKQARNAEKQGNLAEAKNIRSKADKLFKFAEPKIGLLPDVFNFQKYETAKSINERIQQGNFSSKQDVGHEVRPDSLPMDNELARKGSFERRDQKESRRIGNVDVNVTAVYKPLKSVIDGIKKRFKNATIDNEILEITGDPKAFHRFISDSRLENPKGASVFVYPKERNIESDGYDHMRLFITPDGKTGVALKEDGDLVSGFSSPSAGKKNRVPQLLLLAIKEGATKADCFHTVLPDYYSSVGFRAISKIKFDPKEKPPAYVDDYGRDQKGWNEDDFKEYNNGRPDVVYLAYDGGDRATIQDRVGQFDDYTSYTEKTIDHKDYDTATAATEKASKGQFSRGERGAEEETKSLTLPDGRKVETKQLPEDVEVVNGFYSPLEKTIVESKQDKMPAKQWAEKYANSEEAKWTGLKDWLSQQQGSVSKADIQKYLKDNRISVVEVVKGSEDIKDVEARKTDLANQLNEKGYTIEWDMGGDGAMLIGKDGEMVDYDEMPSDVRPLYSEYHRISMPEHDAYEGNTGMTKFGQYQLEGQKENYKEVLVTMPKNEEKSIAEYNKVRDELDKFERSINLPTKEDKIKFSQLSEKIQALEKNLPKDTIIQQGRAYTGKQPFKSSHFDEPNILVHLRMNTRVDAEGNKVLFLEEVQSDWGQKGKKEGFKDDAKQKQWDELENQRQELWSEVNEKYKGQIVPPLLQQKINEVVKKQQALYEGLQTPTAPFVTDTNAWTKLGLKVALKEAVKQGADKIAWTTGEQQNERYDLSKQVDVIDGKRNKDGTYEITATKDGSKIFGKSDMPLKEIEDTFGKDVAQKINDNKSPLINISGDNLKAGGKGMKGFYGSPKEGSLGIVGNVAKSLFKQEPKTVEISTGEKKYEFNVEDNEDGTYRVSIDGDAVYGDSEGEGFKTKQEARNFAIKEIASFKGDQSLKSTQHSIDITPEMKAQVEAGLPQFSKGNREVDDKLVNWIKENRDNGLTDEEISAALKEYKYTDKKINDLIEQSKTKENAVQEQPTEKVGAYPSGDEGLGRKEEGTGVGQGEQGAQPSKQGEEQVLTEEEKFSIKNSYAVKRAAELGYTEDYQKATEDSAREFGTVWDEAAKAVDSKKVDPEQLEADLIKSPRPLSDKEDAILLYRNISLENELKSVIDEINAKKGENIDDLLARKAKIEKSIMTNYEASKIGGRETARGLAARRMLATRKYSLANMTAEAMANNKGEPLSAEQSEAVEKLHNKIAKATETLNEFQKDPEKWARMMAEGDAIDNLRKSINRQKKVTVLSEEKQLRKQELRNKFLGVFNDVTNVAKALVDKEFYEYAGLVFEEAAGDFKKFASKMIAGAGIGVRKHLADIYKEVGGKGATDFEYNVKKENNLLYVPRELIRDLVESGVSDVDTLVSKVSEVVREKLPNVTDSEIKDAIIGYSREINLSKKEISDRIKDLKKELREATGVEGERKNEAYRKNLLNRINNYRDRIDKGDYEKKKKKTFTKDEASLNLQAELQQAKDDFEFEKEKIRLKNLGWSQKAIDKVIKLYRESILSGVHTLGKLASFAIFKQLVKPVYNMTGKTLELIPFIKKIAERAPSEGGFNASSIGESYKTFFRKKTYEEAWDKFQTGKSKNDLAYGVTKDFGKPMIFTRSHGLIKYPAYKAEFNYVRDALTKWAEKNGRADDPAFDAWANSYAHAKGLDAIYMGESKLLRQYRMNVRMWEQSPSLGKRALANMSNFLFPIVKVPYNFAKDVMINHNPLKALLEIQKAYKKGIENLTPEEADLIMLNLKKGAVGTVAFALGALMYKNFGGNYVNEKSEKDEDLKPGDVSIFGVHVPHMMTHNSLMEVMQMGATFARLFNSAPDDYGTVTNAVYTTLLTNLSELEKAPFYGELTRLSTRATTRKGIGALVGEKVAGFIPRAVQEFGEYMDNGTKRKAVGFLETIQSKIPFIREWLPVEPEPGARKHKASKATGGAVPAERGASSKSRAVPADRSGSSRSKVVPAKR